MAVAVEQRSLEHSATPKALGQRIRENKNFYLMVSPFFVLFAVFGFFPILAALWLGFTNWDGLNPPEFVGLDNYVQIITSQAFGQTVFNTIYIWVGSTVLTVGLAFLLAYAINEYVLVGRNVLRMIFLMPLLVAPAVIAIITSVLFSTNAGLATAFVRLVTGDETWSYEWLQSAGWIKPIIIFMIVWRFLGFHMIIFVAGLQTIPRDLYDAAKVDGAGGWRVFRHITFPMMLPVLFFSATSSTVGAFQLFDEPFVLTGGTPGPAGSAEVLGTLLYRTAFNEFRLGTASALSWIIFALIAIFTILNSRMLRSRNQ